MRTLDLSKRSLRSLLSAKIRTVLTALAIAVGTFALTLTLAASNGAKRYADIIINDNFNPSELIVTNDPTILGAASSDKPREYNANFGSITNSAGAAQQIKFLGQADLNRIAEVPGVAKVRPEISLSAQYLTRDGQKKYVATAVAYSSYKVPELLAGSIPTTIPAKAIILPEGFVPALGFASPGEAIGKAVRLSVSKQFDQSKILSSLLAGNSDALQSSTTTSSKEEMFTVLAVTKKPSTLVQPGTELYIKLSPTTVQQLDDYTGEGSANYQKYATAYATITDGKNDTSALNAAQSSIKKLGYGAQSVADTQKTITQVITVLQGIVSVFGLIAVVASVFGIINTMYISVLQRTREIGLMKALGMHKKDITKLFLFEAALLGLLGGLFGSAVAVGLGTLLNPTISDKLGLGSVQLLYFKPLQIVLLVAALMLVAVVAGLLPARKAAKLDPIAALRTE